MPSLAMSLSSILGTDPITLIVVCLMASVCGVIMRGMLPYPWLAVVTYPLLLTGGLIAELLAANLGLIEPIDIRLDGDGELYTRWSTAAEAMPMIILATTAGLCSSALAIVFTLKAARDHL